MSAQSSTRCVPSGILLHVPDVTSCDALGTRAVIVGAVRVTLNEPLFPMSILKRLLKVPPAVESPRLRTVPLKVTSEPRTRVPLFKLGATKMSRSGAVTVYIVVFVLLSSFASEIVQGEGEGSESTIAVAVYAPGMGGNVIEILNGRETPAPRADTETRPCSVVAQVILPVFLFIATLNPPPVEPVLSFLILMLAVTV